MEHINSHVAVKIANLTTREKPVWGHKPGKPAYDLIPRECFVPEGEVGVPVGCKVIKTLHGDYWGQNGRMHVSQARRHARELADKLMARGIRAGVVARVARYWTGRDWYGRTYPDGYQDFVVWAECDGPMSPWPDEREKEFFKKYLKP